MNSLEQLRSALQGIQAHAAGMHFNADMALKILAGMQNEQQAPVLPQKKSGDPTHYGDPETEIEAVFATLEDSGGPSPNPPA